MRPYVRPYERRRFNRVDMAAPDCRLTLMCDREGRRERQVCTLVDLSYAGLRIKRVEQQDVEEPTAIKIGDSAEQAQSGGLLAFARQEPLDRQKRFDRAADDLAADRPVVILHLLHVDAIERLRATELRRCEEWLGTR